MKKTLAAIIATLTVAVASAATPAPKPAPAAADNATTQATPVKKHKQVKHAKKAPMKKMKKDTAQPKA